MASDAVFTAVRDFLTENWQMTPVGYENEGFTGPPDTIWVMCEVYEFSDDQVSIGAGSPVANRWREQGAVILYINAPVGTGSLQARQIGVALKNLLRGLELPDTLRFESMSLGDGGVGDDHGLWWSLVLRADYIQG